MGGLGKRQVARENTNRDGCQAVSLRQAVRLITILESLTQLIK